MLTKNKYHMPEAFRSRVKKEIIPTNTTEASQSNKQEHELSPEIQSWKAMIAWMKNRLGAEKKVLLTDSDIPYLQAILKRGTLEVLDRAGVEGKHMDQSKTAGFCDKIKENPQLLNAIRESITEYFMITQSINPKLGFAAIELRSGLPELVLTGLAKQLVEQNEHYGEYAKDIPEYITNYRDSAARIVISLENVRHNTAISFHPRGNTGLENYSLN